MPRSSQSSLRRRTCASATLLSILALACVSPAAALAQSAGDEQYRDPLAGQNKGGGNSGGGNNSGGNTTNQNGTNSSQGTTTQPQTTTGQTQSGTTADGTVAGTTAGSTAGGKGTLPRTGFDGWVPAASLGAAFVLGGFALRRGARSTPTRA